MVQQEVDVGPKPARLAQSHVLNCSAELPPCPGHSRPPRSNPPSHEGCSGPGPIKGKTETEIVSWNNQANVTKRQGDEKAVNLAQQWRGTIMKFRGFLGNQMFFYNIIWKKKKKNIENVLINSLQRLYSTTSTPPKRSFIVSSVSSSLWSY